MLGNGSISRVLEASGRDVVSTDLVDRGYGQGGVDFFRVDVPPTKAIVTNPSFALAREMIEHAVQIGIDYIAFLQQPHWLNTQKMGRTVEEVWCPDRTYHLLFRADFRNQGAPPQPINWWIFERHSMKRTVWTARLLWRPAVAPARHQNRHHGKS
jgi:hypothetical protein